nr:hypothetical protein [Tanacetum cinerariifolium]
MTRIVMANPNPEDPNVPNEDVLEEDPYHLLDYEEEEDLEIDIEEEEPEEDPGDQTLLPRDESSDYEFEAEEADDELKVEEAGVEPDIEEANKADEATEGEKRIGESDRGGRDDNQREHNRRQNQRRGNVGAMTNAAPNNNKTCQKFKNKRHA